MTPKLTAIAAAGAFALGLLVAGVAQSWNYGAQLAEKDAAHALELKAISDRAAAQRASALATQQQLQAQAAANDLKHTEELTDAQSKNEQLRRQYLAAEQRATAAAADAADTRRRLRVQAKCPAAGSVVPQAGGAGSLGDAATVELSDAAGQNVFDIRAGIIADQAKLRYLQDYARTCSQ